MPETQNSAASTGPEGASRLTVLEAGCIRRRFSTWTSCPCAPCKADRARTRKHSKAGILTRVTSDQAWAVLDEMLARDWTGAAIASACGIPNRTVWLILQESGSGHRRTIGARLAAQIVNHGQPTAGNVGAVGSQRKVRALARLGHPCSAIEEASGLPRATITLITRGQTKRTKPHVAAAIDKAWREMCLSTGTCKRARNRAIAAGWPAPLAWDDIDDPMEAPKGVAGVAA